MHHDGVLTIVGSGIQLVSHLTLGARAWIEQADTVLYFVPDAATAHWLTQLNPAARALTPPEQDGRRGQMYRHMAQTILTEVRKGGLVCALFYGHPGVGVDPGHLALRLAREAGFEARMLPGISAEACLYADLGIDPCRQGCQSYEATDFLIRPPRFDPRGLLILWQVGFIGNLNLYDEDAVVAGLQILREHLLRFYAPQREVILYEAAVYAAAAPVIQRLTLAELTSGERVTDRTTLCIPATEIELDRAMVQRLGLSTASLKPKPCTSAS